MKERENKTYRIKKKKKKEKGLKQQSRREKKERERQQTPTNEQTKLLEYAARFHRMRRRPHPSYIQVGSEQMGSRKTPRDLAGCWLIEVGPQPKGEK